MPKENTAVQNLNQNTERLLSLLESMAARDVPARLADIAEGCDLNISTVSRLMSSLIALGYADKDPDTGLYFLTYKICKIGYSVKQHEDIGRSALPYLKKLASSTGLAAGIFVESEDAARCLKIVYGKAKPEAEDPEWKNEIPLFCTAPGKIFLNACSDLKRRAYLSRTAMAARTEHTVTDAESLRRELMMAGVQGFAEEAEEYRKNVCGIAAAVKDFTGKTAASAALYGSPSDLSEEKKRRAAADLQKAARQISAALGYDTEEENNRPYRR